MKNKEKRLLAIILTAVLTFSLCGCGNGAGKGDAGHAGAPGGSADVQEGQEGSVPGGSSADNAADDRVFWITQTGSSTADIYLRDPAVDQLKKDGEDCINWLNVDFYVGDRQVIWGSLYADHLNVAVYTENGGEAAIYNEAGETYTIPAEAPYPDQTVCWHVCDRRVSLILR